MPNVEIGLRQLGKMLPRITSFLQLLRESESEIQKRVNEMDEVPLSVFLFSVPSPT